MTPAPHQGTALDPQNARALLAEAAALRERNELEDAGRRLADAEALLRPPQPGATGPFESWEGVSLLAEGGPDRLVLLAELEGERGLQAQRAGDTHAAERAYRRAVEYAAASEAPRALLPWVTNLGNACSRRRCWTEAQAHYGRGLACAQGLGDAAWVRRVAQARAVSYNRAHRPADAAAALRAAASVDPDPHQRFRFLHEAFSRLQFAGEWAVAAEVGAELAVQGRSLGAEAGMLAALDEEIARVARMRDGEFPPNREGPTPLDLHIGRQMQRYMAAADENALLALADVAHLICDVQLGLTEPTEAQWRTVLSDTSWRHRVIADVVARLADAERRTELLEVLQRYKSVGYALSAITPLERAAPEDAGVARYLERLAALRQAVSALAGPAQPDFVVAIERVRAAGEALLEAGEQLREHDAVMSARLGGIVPAADFIDALPLPERLAIVDVVVGGEGTAGCVLWRTERGVVVAPLLIPVFTAEHALQLSRTWVEAQVPTSFGGEQGAALDELSQVLHDRLLCHLTRHLGSLGITQLVLIPDLTLRHLPLHLARVCGEEIAVPGVDTEGAEYVCEVMPIEYASCLQAVAASRYSRRPRAVRRIVSLADPHGDLPAARKSAEWLDARVAADAPMDAGGEGGGVRPAHELRLGEAATVAAFEAALHDADIVIAGTHGSFDPVDPRNTQLVLHDGPWLMPDAEHVPTIGRRPLLLLSACEAGAVGMVTDERVALGLPGALAAAGAATVIAGLWPLEDISTGYLVEQFVHFLTHRGYRPAAALFRAVRKVRRLTRAEALDRCRAFARELEQEGADDRQILMVENLAEWIEESDAEFPFAHPVFWGGIVTVGSGWNAPAGALVGGADQLMENITGQLELQGAEQAIAEGDYSGARRRLEALLPRLDGGPRVQALTGLARAIAWGGSGWTRESGRLEALALLREADRLARAEEDEKVRAWIRELMDSVS